MKIFIIGITGAIGGLLAQKLLDRGDEVGGLVRREEQQRELESRGIRAHLGDLASMSADDLEATLGGVDAIVFAAGSNGGAKGVTRAIDGDGVDTAIAAALGAGVERLVLVSVLPEAGRESGLSDDEEYYFAVKKEADVALAHSALDWVILRPSMLLDGDGAGTVSLSAAELHGAITRDDVASTLVELLHETRINRQILELDHGTTPIADAVRANVRVATG